MTKYVAFLRGIGPSNPNMHNSNLVKFFEQLGYSNVAAVISSGNVLFESSSSDVKNMEDKIEEELPRRLGFSSTAIIRSQEDLQKLIDKNPFAGLEHSRKTSLNVTFLKNKPEDLSGLIDGVGYKFVKMYDREICSVIDTTTAKTPAVMSVLEKNLGKQITTRTYATLRRILNKF